MSRHQNWIMTRVYWEVFSHVREPRISIRHCLTQHFTSAVLRAAICHISSLAGSSMVDRKNIDMPFISGRERTDTSKHSTQTNLIAFKRFCARAQRTIREANAHLFGVCLHPVSFDGFGCLLEVSTAHVRKMPSDPRS
jgi:hypothetical protein